MEGDFDQQLRDLLALDDEISRRQDELKKFNEQYDDLSWKLAMYMEQTGTDSKKIDGVNFIKARRVFSKVEDKGAFMDWVMANSMWDVTHMVSAQKLNSYCKELIENGAETPPGVNPNHVKNYVQIRRS
jgi:hypothetical protein